MDMHRVFCMRNDTDDLEGEAGNMLQFNHLADLLEEYRIDFVRKDQNMTVGQFRNQIEVFDPNNKNIRLFDVIYFEGTYGYEYGLLEYWDDDLKEAGHDPIGNVSAEWVMGYITAKFGEALGLDHYC